MKILKNIINSFSKTDIVLWIGSAGLITAAFLVFDGKNYMTLVASLIGVTSLVLNAKGNPTGQLLMIVFSILYGIISFSFAYYGEMLTYLCMTMPMAVFAFFSWLKNPYNGNKSQVKINRLTKKETVFMWFFAAVVTFVFYYVLKYFDTANIVPSTISVTTSFLAVYLTYKRNPFYAVGYAANDIVLIVLWVLASIENRSYISVVVCFVVFAVNDIYGFINWRKTEKIQSSEMN